MNQASLDFGKRVRQARRHINVTQAELGQTLGTSHVTISTLENGQMRQFDIGNFITLCTWAADHGVSVAWLMTGRGEMLRPDDGSVQQAIRIGVAFRAAADVLISKLSDYGTDQET
jgi:transcriptional regulator with XRE-family HTH domain